MHKTRLLNIRHAVKEHREKTALAKKVGCHVQTLYQIANGTIEDPGTTLIEGLCEALKLDARTGRPIQANVSRPMPLTMTETAAAIFPFRGYVCAGTGSEFSDTVTFDDTDARTAGFGPAFWGARNGHRLSVIQVQGDSMEPTYFEDDLVVFEETQNPEDMRNGDHVIVDVGGGSMLLRVWIKGLSLLSPINARQHDPIRWPERAMLVGIVQGLVRKIRS